MSAGDAMPHDPFVESDGAVDTEPEGERILHALIEAAMEPTLEPFANAMGALSEADLKAVAMSQALRIVRAVQEDRGHRRRGGRLRRSAAAGVEAFRREWSR